MWAQQEDKFRKQCKRLSVDALKERQKELLAQKEVLIDRGAAASAEAIAEVRTKLKIVERVLAVKQGLGGGLARGGSDD